MSILNRRKFWFVFPIIVIALAVTWQFALAQAPTPNPLATNPGANLAANGPAASMHGSPLNGRALFAANCATCHGERGTKGEDNPGSDDGEVPALNPASEFQDAAQGDPATFANAIDLFIQHGSRPAGDNPDMLMPAWGDKKLLSQAQIADVEAYVMQLNNLYWPDRWYPPAEVQMDAQRSGTIITYTITIVNHGGSELEDVLLRDTLPPGLAFIKSDYYGLGNNPAQVVGSTVEWTTGPVPVGETLGPFIIVTGMTGKTVPANVSQIVFSYAGSDGDSVPASQVSDPVVPK